MLFSALHNRWCKASGHTLTHHEACLSPAEVRGNQKILDGRYNVKNEHENVSQRDFFKKGYFISMEVGLCEELDEFGDQGRNSDG